MNTERDGELVIVLRLQERHIAIDCSLRLLEVDFLSSRYLNQRLVEQVVGERESFVLVRGLGAGLYLAPSIGNPHAAEPRRFFDLATGVGKSPRP